MEPDEGPTDCFDESQGYSSLAHPAIFKKPKISPSFEMAEKSDVLLQRKGHAMKDRIALLGIVILACQFSPSYLARTSADQIGIASVYSVESGRRTASGQELNREALTAAHRTLPLGTKVTVTNKSNGHSVVVTINDRGPFVRGRIIDLSPAAARVLGFSGLTHVTVNGE
jgi:rare lipoprotein A